MDLGAELKIGLAAEVLRSSGELRLRVTGTSMLPAIWPGEVLLIRRDGAAQAGPGDRLMHDDQPVSAGELLGRVVGVPRQTAAQRAAAFVMARSWLVTRLALRLRRSSVPP
jgi:signal peptidase